MTEAVLEFKKRRLYFLANEIPELKRWIKAHIRKNGDYTHYAEMKEKVERYRQFKAERIRLVKELREILNKDNNMKSD